MFRGVEAVMKDLAAEIQHEMDRYIGKDLPDDWYSEDYYRSEFPLHKILNTVMDFLKFSSTQEVAFDILHRMSKVDTCVKVMDELNLYKEVAKYLQDSSLMMDVYLAMLTFRQSDRFHIEVDQHTLVVLKRLSFRLDDDGCKKALQIASVLTRFHPDVDFRYLFRYFMKHLESPNVDILEPVMEIIAYISSQHKLDSFDFPIEKFLPILHRGIVGSNFKLTGFCLSIFQKMTIDFPQNKILDQAWNFCSAFISILRPWMFHVNGPEADFLLALFATHDGPRMFHIIAKERPPIHQIPQLQRAMNKFLEDNLDSTGELLDSIPVETIIEVAKYLNIYEGSIKESLTRSTEQKMIRDKWDALDVGSLPVPNDFFCPITHAIMMDPVVASDGVSYERKALEGWVNKLPHAISPLTREELLPQKFPNKVLKRRIRDYQDEMLAVVENAKKKMKTF